MSVLAAPDTMEGRRRTSNTMTRNWPQFDAERPPNNYKVFTKTQLHRTPPLGSLGLLFVQTAHSPVPSLHNRPMTTKVPVTCHGKSAYFFKGD
jgi:hypothetical protein